VGVITLDLQPDLRDHRLATVGPQELTLSVADANATCHSAASSMSLFSGVPIESCRSASSRPNLRELLHERWGGRVALLVLGTRQECIVHFDQSLGASASQTDDGQRGASVEVFRLAGITRLNMATNADSAGAIVFAVSHAK